MIKGPVRYRIPAASVIVSLFLSIVLADGWKSGKRSPSGDHRVTEDHEKSANDTQVTQEEVEVEDEAVTESLDEDNTEKSTNSKFGVLLRDNGTRTGKHGLKHPQGHSSHPVTRANWVRNDAR